SVDLCPLVSVSRSLVTAAAFTWYCPLSLHDALPISVSWAFSSAFKCALAILITPIVMSWRMGGLQFGRPSDQLIVTAIHTPRARSEEHTSELQSRENLVCRLLLEKKKKKNRHTEQSE